METFPELFDNSGDFSAFKFVPRRDILHETVCRYLANMEAPVDPRTCALTVRVVLTQSFRDITRFANKKLGTGGSRIEKAVGDHGNESFYSIES